MRRLILIAFCVAGCSDHTNGVGGNLGGGTADLAGTRHDAGNPGPGSDAGTPGCGAQGCFTVYAHSNHVLYHIDLASKKLVTIGNFNASGNDVMTDLAIAPDGTIYVISETNLYTADPADGHVTLLGKVTACGTYAVALTFGPDGTMYAADFHGAFCKIDPGQKPPLVTQIATLGGGLAISGDLVSVRDGTMFGTAYNLSDPSGHGTQIDNLLVKLDPATGQVIKTVGKTGYPEIFGVAFELGQVFGFTHDGSARRTTPSPNRRPARASASPAPASAPWWPRRPSDEQRAETFVKFNARCGRSGNPSRAAFAPWTSGSTGRCGWRLGARPSIRPRSAATWLIDGLESRAKS
jgi:hypothetical protein